MRLALLIAASLLTSTAAFADSLSNSLAPQLTLGLQFGGGTRNAAPMRFTALFDVRSQLLRRDPELAHSGLATLSAGVPLLSVFEFSASHKGVDLVNVLGNNMLAKSDRLNDAGESPWYEHKWIWWTPPPGGSSGVNTSNPNQSNPSCLVGG